MQDIVSPDAPEDIYISPVGCYGIIRRKTERNLKINPRLEKVLLSISAEMSSEEIEKRSRVQHRGRFSISGEADSTVDGKAVVKPLANPISKKEQSSSSRVKKTFSNADFDKCPEGQLSLLDFI